MASIIDLIARGILIPNISRCVEKESGDPIFGTTGSLTEAIDSEQNCQCARHFQDSLVQGCKMTTSYKGDEVLFQVIKGH